MNQVSKKFLCEFCEKSFVKETTLVKHMCEAKRRMLAKNKQGNRLGFSAFHQFYNKHSTKKKTYEDFIKSSYYTAFVKFGTYCADVQVINVARYVDWLLENQVSIDTWNRDSNYTKFIIDFLKTEDPLDAIARSIETTIKLAEEDKILTRDIFKYGNRQKVCYEITKGKISPWMLYQSSSGIQFLESIDATQQKMIFDYINPEQWAIRFCKHKDILPQVKELLHVGGY